MEGRNTRVCVTGGSGYIGSWLVKKLLSRGYVVHATVRNSEDKSKVGLLKSFPKASDTNLVLFQADICNPSEFEPAIEGCEFVFHVATPMQHDPKTAKGKSRIEATVDGVKSIVDSCLRSRTVKRLIYTASVLASSALTEDGKGFKSAIDESCWTPLHLPFPNSNDYTLEYARAKTLAEKAALSYDEEHGSKLEVVTLACGLVGGETLTPNTPSSVEVIISQITGNLFGYNHGLRFMEDVLDSVPLVHIDDVCEAHIFCMKKPSLKGRFICAAANPTSREMAIYFQENYPEYQIDGRFLGKPGSGVLCDSSKLKKMGFQCKYDMKQIMDESLKCGKRLGSLSC